MKPKYVRVVLILLAAFGLTACDFLNFEAPNDEAAEACRAKTIGTVEGSKTEISCEAFEENGMVKQLVPVAGTAANWKGTVTVGGQKFVEMTSPAVAPAPNAKPGLIVMVEVGTYEANKENVANSSFSGMMNKEIPAGLRDNIRMFMSNFTKAFLEETIDRVGQKYGHVYFVKSDSRLKEIFLQTLKKATTAHDKVDILLVGHGSPGEMILNSGLKAGPENLTGQELVDFAVKEMPLRSRVRAIFQTHCFTHSYFPSVPNSKAIYAAYGEAFPNAMFYGSNGVNSFPLHRDIIAFEKYYEFLNTGTPRPFTTAVTFANDFIHNSNGSQRTAIVFPAVKGRGCMRILGFNKCMSRAQETATISLVGTDAGTGQKVVNLKYFKDSDPVLGGVLEQ